MAQDGLTWATIVSIVLAFMKFFEGRKKKAAYDRMERKIDALMQDGGIPWNDPQDASQRAERRLKRLIKLFIRRRKKMQISKAWLSGVIAYLLGQAALKYGFTFKDEWADMGADIIITFVLPLFVAWLNRNKISVPEVKQSTPEPKQDPKPQEIDPDKFIMG